MRASPINTQNAFSESPFKCFRNLVDRRERSKSDDERLSSSRLVMSCCLMPARKPPLSLVMSDWEVCLPHTTQNFKPKFSVAPQYGQEAGIRKLFFPRSWAIA